MKKSVALLTTALLGASFVLGTTACDKKASSPFKEITVSETTTKITAVTKENMPKIVSPLERVGQVCDEAAKDCGLPVGRQGRSGQYGGNRYAVPIFRKCIGENLC